MQNNLPEKQIACLFDLDGVLVDTAVYHYQAWKQLANRLGFDFTEAQNELANLLKAMAHPARIAIIEFLLKTDACICGDIVKELPLSQPTVSQHLKELKNAGIIQGNVEGTAICYCLNPEAFSKIQKSIGGISETLKIKNESSCC